MDPLWLWLGFMLLAYGLGSVSFACLIGRLRGVDVRRQGSGNPGATNVGRLLGRRWGITCFVLDLLKGLLPTFAYGVASGVMQAAMTQNSTQDTAALSALAMLAWLAVAAAAIAGHMFSIFLGGRGGKGVATSLGALLGIFPILSLAAAGGLVIWLAVMRSTGYVSLSSVVAALALPLLTLILTLTMDWPNDGALVLVVMMSLLALVVVLKHRSNITRLRAGTEPRATWFGPGRTEKRR